jgi:hypothetical protein
MRVGGVQYDPNERVKLTQIYKPQQLNTDRFANDTVRVSDRTFNNLETSQKVIDRINELMPYGYGNQHWDIQHTKGESAMRMDLARRDGYSCVQTGAGNCGESASLGMRIAGSQVKNQPVMKVSAQGLDHGFTVIGDRREVGDQNVTVVDAWPSFSTPHTFDRSVIADYQVLNASRHEDFNIGDYQKPMSSQLLEKEYAKHFKSGFDLTKEYQYFADKMWVQRTFGGDPSTRYVSDSHPLGRVFDDVAAYYVAKYDGFIKDNDDFRGPLFRKK